METLEIPSGTDINAASKEAVRVAKASGETVRFVFNGTEVFVTPRHEDAIVGMYFALRRERR